VPARNEILAAARALLEEEGTQALTMRRLAHRLGIQAPSLYKHVRGKAELERAVAEAAVGELGRALAEAGSAGEAAAAYRRWALACPRAYPLAAALRHRTADLPCFHGDRPHGLATVALAHGLVELELAGTAPREELDAAWALALAALGAPPEPAALRAAEPAAGRAVFASYRVD
jgi:AcrR family transcriptional regulator